MLEQRLNNAREQGACVAPEKEMYIEPRLSMLKNWEVHIKVVDVGCIIHVGCKMFAFSSLQEGLKELNTYFEDPNYAREKWSKIESELS